MVGAARFEPTAPDAETSMNSGDCPSLLPEYTQGASQPAGPVCPVLARLVTVWFSLPEHIRQTIALLVDTHKS
jgi:hypothetical protein